MKNKRLTIQGNYQTAWDDNWKNPCILEHLLTDQHKTRNLIEVLKALRMKIQAYTDNKWFDVVETN